MKRILVAAAIIPFVSGCASIISESAYPVSVNSSPVGASFVISNREGNTVATGTTPEVVTLVAGNGYFKKGSYQIVVSKDGYPDKTYAITASLDGWYWGNILLGGLVGLLIVDPATGAMYKLPDRVDISMDEQAATMQQSVDILFATVDSLSARQRSQLVPVN
jgi:hypothetical protein